MFTKTHRDTCKGMSTSPRSDGDLHNSNVALRSSCDACTNVKMACSKEKPTCARCARRGEVCVYTPVKRAGRKKQRHSHQSPSQHEQRQRRRSEDNSVDAQTTVASHGDSLIHQPMSMDWFMSESMNILTGSVDAFPLAKVTGNESEIPIESAGSGYASEKSPNGQGSGNATAYKFAGPGDFMPLENVDYPVFDEIDWLASITSTSPPEQEAVHTSRSVSAGQASAASVLGSICTSSPSCMNRALGILWALSPGLETCSSKLRENDTESDQGIMMNLSTKGLKIHTFQDVMEQNQASIEAIHPILKCSCASDSSIVFTLSHIIFRILAWYAACARVPLAASCMPLGQQTWLPSVKPPIASSMPGYDMSEEGAQNRVLCQTVLSKMHAVRNLVDCLSKILLGDTSQANPSQGQFQGRDLGSPMSVDRSPSALAISLENQLRCCLRDASRAVVAKLAEG